MQDKLQRQSSITVIRLGFAPWLLHFFPLISKHAIFRSFYCCIPWKILKGFNLIYLEDKGFEKKMKKQSQSKPKKHSETITKYTSRKQNSARFLILECKNTKVLGRFKIYLGKAMKRSNSSVHLKMGNICEEILFRVFVNQNHQSSQTIWELKTNTPQKREMFLQKIWTWVFE